MWASIACRTVGRATLSTVDRDDSGRAEPCPEAKGSSCEFGVTVACDRKSRTAPRRVAFVPRPGSCVRLGQVSVKALPTGRRSGLG